jgi:hypothetical protein
MSEDNPKKPMPSVAEINAYLELSAARTKKRLPLAFNKTSAPKPAPVERKLRLTSSAKPGFPGNAAEPVAVPKPASDEPTVSTELLQGLQPRPDKQLK